MRSLVETLNEYEQSYLHQRLVTPSESDIAEGYRYLLHLLTAGIELFVEGNPSHPEMAQIVSPTRKLLGDNADAYYFHASIAADGDYRVHGHNTGEIYLSLTVHSGDEPGGWANGVVGALNNQQFATDAEGNWEVLLGQSVSGPNAIRTTPDTVSVISRHCYLNKTYAAADPNVHPRILIERLDKVPPPAPPTYAAGMFRLGPDEALIIKGSMPECIFSSVLLWNKYLQSFDFRYRQVSLNKAQMEQADDGSFTVVVAHRNPGVANWLDTEGRESASCIGALCCRWVRLRRWKPASCRWPTFNPKYRVPLLGQWMQGCSGSVRLQQCPQRRLVDLAGRRVGNPGSINRSGISP